MATLSADLSAALGGDTSSAQFPVLPGLIVEDTEQLDGTITQTGISGREYRQTFQVTPRFRFTVRISFLRSRTGFLEWQALAGFVARVGVGLDSFTWEHPEDKSVVAHPFGRGDGSEVDFQLQRTIVPVASLPDPSVRFYWPTFGDGYCPVFALATTPSIYVGGVLQVVSTHYSLSSTGQVTFVSAPASGAILTWTGTYFWRVRIEGNVRTRRLLTQVWQGDSISLITVKP